MIKLVASQNTLNHQIKTTTIAVMYMVFKGSVNANCVYMETNNLQ